MIDIHFRVDANENIGGGHFSRCLNLALELKGRGKKVGFICNWKSKKFCIDKLLKHEISVDFLPKKPIKVDLSVLEESVTASSLEKIDSIQTGKIIGRSQSAWIVIDSYDLSYQFERMIRGSVRNIAVIEDLLHRRHDCDLLIDQNYVDLESRGYQDRLPSACLILKGPKFSLISSEIKKVKARNVWAKIPKKIFLYCGTSDQKNLTELVLDALSCEAFLNFEVMVVIGASNTNRGYLESKFRGSKYLQLNFISSGLNFFKILKSCDFSIGAGGTTMWERMYLGVPSIVVSVASNQEASSETLDRDGYVQYMGRIEQINYLNLRDAIKVYVASYGNITPIVLKGKKLVDGNGVVKVADAMMEF